jgi:signal peptidase II
VIVAGVVVLVVALLGLGGRASRTASRPATMAMGLLLGGAIGNLTDRLVRHHHGAVIDFIDLRWWPVFNLADASITIGAVLWIAVGLRTRPTHQPAAGPARAVTAPGIGDQPHAND